MTQHPTLPAAEAFRLLCINKSMSVIDVRSEGEYEKAHFEHTLNVPILSNAHRHDVGLTYKTEGSEAAKTLGHKLVSGDYKEELISRWCESIKKHPDEPSLIFCWRGGLRSRLAQEWIYQNGYEAIRVDGGYKGLRHEALKVLENPSPFVILSGMTGSGKTRLLRQLHHFVDLEGIANHRGSAFGAHVGVVQPQQATFENRLAQSLYRAGDHTVLEDESPNIGRCRLPENIYARMATAPMVVIETPVYLRAVEIVNEYIQTPFSAGILLDELQQRFAKNIDRIRNKLGGLECDIVKGLLTQAFKIDPMTEDGLAAHVDWIERLLTRYYDRQYLYSRSLKSRKTLFKGAWEDCLDFLQNLQHE